MTIREQIDLAVAGLAAWAKKHKGRVFPAADVVQAIEELRRTPGGASCGILFWTEDPQGEYPELGKVLRGFKAIVSRGTGFNLVSGESLTKGAAGGAAMFDLVEEARNALLALRVTDEDGELNIPVYQGTGPFEVQGVILDAYEIRVGLFAQIALQEPALDEEEEE